MTASASPQPPSDHRFSQFVRRLALKPYGDELLTRSLRDALALVDVKVLDHFIIAGSHAISFAERGLL